MPMYEYECNKCGGRFEELQGLNDNHLDVCNLCGSVGSVNRLIGNANFMFKGNGFYITENRSDSYKQGATAEQANINVAQ